MMTNMPHQGVGFKSPVARTAKRPQPNWTATDCNRTFGCSPWGCSPVAVAVALIVDGLVNRGQPAGTDCNRLQTPVAINVPGKCIIATGNTKSSFSPSPSPNSRSTACWSSSSPPPTRGLQPHKCPTPHSALTLEPAFIILANTLRSMLPSQ